MTSNKTTNINKQNWLQFLFVVKATALKQANMKNLSANSKHRSLLLHRPLTGINVVAGFCV